MPPPYGVTPQGFNPKTLLEAKAEIEADFRATFGASVDLTPSSPHGQLAAIIADRMSELWDAAEDVATTFDPEQATGVSLVNVAALTGTIPLPATHSKVTGIATGSPGTLLPIGRVVSVAGTGKRFTSTAAATIGGGGTVAVPMESEEFGPIIAIAGTLTQIETPVGGWSSFSNALDADEGRDLETDAELRARRVDELSARTAGTVQGIRTTLLGVEGVTSVTVFENTSDVTNGAGMPPHSIEALVMGGALDPIAQALFDTKPAGIATTGSTSGNATDSEGVARVVPFTRPTLKQIYMTLVVQKDPRLFPADGVARIKAALVELGDTYRVGQDVKRSQFYGRVFTVPGVVDVAFFDMGLTAPTIGDPQDTHFTIGARELATFDTSRIAVTATDVVEDAGTY